VITQSLGRWHSSNAPVQGRRAADRPLQPIINSWAQCVSDRLADLGTPRHVVDISHEHLYDHAEIVLEPRYGDFERDIELPVGHENDPLDCLGLHHVRNDRIKGSE
jgi:hypothetical protein